MASETTKTTSTRGATQQENRAAEAATTDDNGYGFGLVSKQEIDAVYEQGFIGTSPERERTGLADKGLSQQTPSVMDSSLPPVDARTSVDDSEAIKAARKAQGGK